MKCSMSDNLPPPSWCWCWPGPASWGSATHSCTCTRSCATACRRWCCEAEVSEVSEVSEDRPPPTWCILTISDNCVTRSGGHEPTSCSTEARMAALA